MDLVTEEIENAIRALSLSDKEFRKLPESEAESIYFELLETFVEGGNRRWWWEAFKNESKSINFEDHKGFERITAIVPNSKELVWFIAEEDQLPFYPVYEGTPEAITKVIGECYAFEYYIVQKNKEWLLCENHYNQVIGVGELVEQRLSQFAA